MFTSGNLTDKNRSGFQSLNQIIRLKKRNFVNKKVADDLHGI